MALVKKTLLRTGVYSAPQGEFRADRRRLERLTRTFHAMKAAGIRVPVSWGHSPYALPGNDRERAEQQFWLGHHNAGYVPDLKLTPSGAWDCGLDVPGCEIDDEGDLVHWVKLPDGRQVKAKVGEVSVGVRPWRDGTGKDWGEALVHVALTPLPVAHGTGGFSATLSLPSFDSHQGGGFTLSLSNLRTLSAEAPVADDLFEEEEGAVKPAKKEGETDAPAEGGHFKDALEYLRKMGLTLPEDTTEENFLERICVACHALENAGEVAEPALDETPGDPEIEDEGEQEYTGEEGQAAEEPRPMMMSLANATDPAARALLTREEASHKAKLLARIERLVKRGLPRARAEKLREHVGGYTLSLDGEFNPAPKSLDRLLSMLEESMPDAHPLKGLQTTGTRRARLAPRPGPEDERAVRQRQEKTGDEIAAMAGARAK